MYDQQLTFDVEMDLDEYDVNHAPVYRLSDMGDPNTLVYNSTDRLMQFSLTLNSLDIKLYELNFSDCIIYNQTDLNKDCYVDFEDFGIIAEEWMTCTDPNNLKCVNVL